MNDLLILWPLTYLLHSTVLLLAAWAVDQLLHRPRWSECLWRGALLGSLVTASVQPWLHTSAAVATGSPAIIAPGPPSSHAVLLEGRLITTGRSAADPVS